jgi:branched-chain amino acid transport system substrate-binding protein
VNRHDRTLAARVGCAIVALAAASSVAACGSSSPSASSGTPTASSAATPASGASSAAALKGVVKIGSIFDVGTAAGNFTEDQGALQAAVRAVNASGGINGSELQLIICNEDLNPNLARSCARQMVSDGVMATVGNQVITAEQDVDTILQSAGIPNIAPVTFSGASDYDTNSYMLSPYGAFTNAAQAYFSIKYGGKRVAQIVLDSPLTASYVPVIKGTVNGEGGDYVGTVEVPQTLTDPSTQAAVLMGYKPDVVILNSAPPVAFALVKDMDSLGYTGKFMSPGTIFYEKDLDELGALADQVLVAQSYPPLSSTQIPGISDFLKDMAADHAAGDSDAPTEKNEVRFSVLNNWLGVKAMAEVANAAHAGDAASLKKALDSAKNVSLFGLLPPWTPNAQLGSVPDPRAVDSAYWCYGWKNGQAVLLTPHPVDMRSMVNTYAKSTQQQ